jgi:guanylate kinase
VGKGTVIRELAKQAHFHLSVSATTRPPRPGEIDGVDYYFLERETFEGWIEADRFLEWAEYAENLYGTPEAAVDLFLEKGEDVVLEIEVQGALQVMDKRPDALFVFVSPPSLAELESRLLGRGDTTDVRSRLARARQEMAVADRFDHQVINDELRASVEQLRSIIVPPEASNDDQPAD